jgi:hypothetical protein
MGSFNKTVLKDSKGSEVLGFVFAKEICVGSVCFALIYIQGEMIYEAPYSSRLGYHWRLLFHSNGPEQRTSSHSPG